MFESSYICNVQTYLVLIAKLTEMKKIANSMEEKAKRVKFTTHLEEEHVRLLKQEALDQKVRPADVLNRIIDQYYN